MTSHGCQMAYGTFIFKPEIIITSKGKILPLECKYEVFKRNGKKKIRFSFENDSSIGYEHDYNTYLQFVHEKVLFGSNGEQYYVEFMDNILGVQYFKIIRATVCVDNDAVVFNRLEVADQMKMTKYIYYNYHHGIMVIIMINWLITR